MGGAPPPPMSASKNCRCWSSVHVDGARRSVGTEADAAALETDGGNGEVRGTST